MAEEVTYHLDEFDGPLDLLLHLIKVNEMDILDIPIVAITEQYLDFLHQAEERNLDIAGEFLVMAATLMSIKSTYLIPKNEELTYDQDLAEFVYEEDPREALMAQLLEYQRYQQAADDLREREEGRQLQFSRAPMAIPEDIEVAPLPEGLGLFDLQLAFNQMVANRTKKQVRPRTLRGETWSIREQMSRMMADMMPSKQRTFTSFFGEDDSRDKLVTTFLAMLELVRHQNLVVTQENEFGTIRLQLGDVPYDENEELDDEE